MELKYKKFLIQSDGKRQFIIRYPAKSDKEQDTLYYYSSMVNLLKAIPDKLMLKSESESINGLKQEIQAFKNFINKNKDKFTYNNGGELDSTG